MKKEVVILRKTETKQVENKENIGNFLGGENAPINFGALEKVYASSFIVPGLLDKISSTIGNDIITENEEIKKIISKIDTIFLYESLEYFGNSFFEIIRDKSGKVVNMLPVITSTIKKLKYGGFIQQVGIDTAYFNDFVSDENERIKKIQIWEQTKVKDTELSAEKVPGYNPNLNEIYHFKSTHLFNKKYGNSKYQNCIDQILLLSQIDLCFSSKFDEGWMGNIILYVDSDNEKAKLSNKSIDIIKEDLKNMKGAKNAGVNSIINTKLGKMDLSQDFKIGEFNEKTIELLKKISIGLNIPFEVILSISGNKSTSEQAEENFYNQKIIPLQQIIIKGLKEIFSNSYEFKDLYFRQRDFKNQNEEMQRITGYTKSKIITQNEAREEIGYDPVDGGDIFLEIKENTSIPNMENNEINKTDYDNINFLHEINETLRNSSL